MKKKLGFDDLHHLARYRPHTDRIRSKYRPLGIAGPFAILAVAACAALPFIRPVVRGLNDLAAALCEQTASENKAALGGMTAKDWCAIQANLDPFIRALTAAQKDAMARTGLNREEKVQP